MVVGLIFLATIPIGLIVFATRGYVSGSEFSPDDFTRRHFSYQQLPWLNWTISGIEYNDVTPELEQSLMKNGLIERRVPPTGQSKTWHLFWDARVPDSHGCDARFLTSYLDFSDWDATTATSKPYWLTWNEAHPDSAKVFWPTIADLARNEMYLVIPTIMRFAMDQSDDDAALFQTELNTFVQQGWFNVGETQLRKGDFGLAVKCLLRAKQLNASDEIEMLLNRCRNQVDNFDQLKHDATKATDDLATTIATLTETVDGSANQNKTKVSAEAGETLTETP
jgi:hypothetical protein